jgi:branched-chain amino acid transport system substrate-binding protein
MSAAVGRRLFPGHVRRRATTGAVAVLMGVAMSLMVAGGAGAATTLKLVTHVGNGTKGKIIAIANAAASKLIGPKGTGLTRGITSSSVKIGCVTSTGSFAGYQTGIEAEVNAVNKKGGIFGRKLTLVGTCKDDNNSAATNTTDNEALVAQDTAFAVLSLSNFEVPGSTDYLNSHQVPYFGWGFDPGFCGYRWGFGFDGDLCGNGFTAPVEAIAGNLVEAMINASKIPDKTVRFAVLGDAIGKIGNAEYDAEIKKLGGKVVYTSFAYPTTAAGVDNTPYIDSIVNSKPNIVFISTPFTDVGPMALGLKAAGYKGVSMDFTNYIPGLLAGSKQLDVALQGEYINTQIVPSEETGAYDKAIQADLKAITKTSLVTLGAYMGFAEAQELAGMLKAAGKNLNTTTFTQAVNGSKKGLTSYATAVADGPGKIVWPAAHYLPADCAAIVKVTATTFKMVSTFSCYTSFLVTKK